MFDYYGLFGRLDASELLIRRWPMVSEVMNNKSMMKVDVEHGNGELEDDEEQEEEGRRGHVHFTNGPG